jgi:DNA (cytosine-5)-methyltransferase 1
MTVNLNERLRHGSLFSGYEGLGLAIEQVFGARTVWVSDIESGPDKVLAFRYPDVPNLGDITRIDWHAVEDVELISGGSPCQDISTAGRQAGMVEGTRSNLWVEMRKAIATLRPMFVVWENVGAARSAKAASASLPDHLDNAITHHLTVAQETNDAPTEARHRRAALRLMEQRAGRVGIAYPKPALRALGRVLGDLADLGYDAAWYSLRAADVGAPHGRLRYFVLAADARGQSWLQRRFASTREGARGRALGEPAGRDRAPIALLPTPMANEGEKAWVGPRQSPGQEYLSHVVGALLLPTVTAQDSEASGGNSSANVTLTDAVVRTEMGTRENPRHSLLPTPRATRGGSNTETVALLPTPAASDGDRTSPTYGRGNDTLIGALLPTPTVAERTNRSASPGAAVRPPLSGIVTNLLPTPSVADSMGGHERRGGECGDELLLKGIASHQAWGPYGPAITRWEHLTRPAPPPTKPGRSGNPRLNPAFAEWMMGAPAGWFSAVPGVTDNEALRLAGNGVCPQQAAAALRICIDRFLTYRD